MDAQAFTHALSYLTLLAQAATLVLVVLYFRDRGAGSRGSLTKWVSRNAYWFAWIAAAVAMAGSLIYSEVIGYAPCLLCWYQRICMYPLVIILAIAAWTRDRAVLKYVFALCLVGGLVALDHVWVQTGGSSLIPCAAPGANAPACDKRFVYEFGYVTLPMMALTAFAFIAALLAHARELPKRRR